jgi:hypothetical protein
MSASRCGSPESRPSAFGQPRTLRRALINVREESDAVLECLQSTSALGRRVGATVTFALCISKQTLANH